MARVNEGSQSFTASHTFIHKWNEPYLPLLPSRRALWLVLISRPTECRRLSWPGWLGEILGGLSVFVDTPNDVTAMPRCHRCRL